MILGVPLKAPPASRASSSRPFPLLVTHPFSQALGREWHFPFCSHRSSPFPHVSGSDRHPRWLCEHLHQEGGLVSSLFYFLNPLCLNHMGMGNKIKQKEKQNLA